MVSSQLAENRFMSWMADNGVWRFSLIKKTRILKFQSRAKMADVKQADNRGITVKLKFLEHAGGWNISGNFHLWILIIIIIIIIIGTPGVYVFIIVTLLIWVFVMLKTLVYFELFLSVESSKLFLSHVNAAPHLEFWPRMFVLKLKVCMPCTGGFLIIISPEQLCICCRFSSAFVKEK